jgi:hypothetical protein
MRISFGRQREYGERKELGPKGSIVLGVILFVIGVGGIVTNGAFEILLEAKDSNNWKPVKATITKSSMGVARSGRRSRNDRYRSGRNRRYDKPRKTKFNFSVKYTYEVDGKRYTGDRVRIGSKGYSSSDVDKYSNWREMYQVGNTATAYYSPANPSKSTLERGIFIESYFLILVFGSFALVGPFVIKKGIGKLNEPVAKVEPRRSKKKVSKSVKHASGDWYVLGGSKRYGPYSESQLMSLYKKGKINKQHICESVDGDHQESVYTILKQAKKAA